MKRASDFLCRKLVPRWFCLLICGCLVPSVNVYAAQTPIERSRYEVFGGDVNGDGRLDLLVRARPVIAMIPLNDLIVPIVVKPPFASFIIRATGSSSYAIDLAPSSADLASNVWQSGLFDVSYGDTLGNAAGSMFVRTHTPGAVSFSIAINPQSNVPQLLQVVDSQTAGRDLGLAGTVTQLSDRNADGRSDLTVSIDGLAADVLLANSSGQFVRDDDSSILAVWGGLKNSLSAGDAATVLRYIAVNSRSKYDSALTELGAQMTNVAATWQTPRALAVTPGVAEYAVGHITDAGPRTVVVTFVREENMWRVEGF